MTKGMVDRATAYMVPAFLTLGRDDTGGGWIGEPAHAFTIASLFTPNLAFVANPSEGPGSGVWGVFLAAMGQLVSQQSPTAALRQRTLTVTHTVIRDPEV